MAPFPVSSCDHVTTPQAVAVAAMVANDLIFRRITATEEYDACVRMQHEIWGETFTEVVPTTILRVAQRIGGVTAGAFDAAGRLMGFVFGMTGTQEGSLVHWSDLLAVHPDARDKGIGRNLKLYQRELLLPLGIRTMFWTYDPLVAKNAYLNIVKLGARPVEYVVDMYGANTQSALHGSLGTDRFVVAWELASGAGAGRAPLVPAADTSDSGGPPPIVNAARGFPDTAVVRVEIPADVQQVIGDDVETAIEWRATTRRAFTHYFGRGYRVTGFTHGSPGDVYYYRLALNGA
ncbi:MAG: hypothetical protein ACR2MQ_03695 [Gemmatimonadaceae bacterium]